MRNQAISGRIPRLGWVLLLACVALGMAAMHTLGHGTHIGMAMTATEHRTIATAATPTLPQPVAQAAPGRTHEGGMDAWSVCLAILGAGAAVVLPALLLRRRPGRAGTPAPLRGKPAPSRPPPRHPPGGLLLAELSVLRI